MVAHHCCPHVGDVKLWLLIIVARMLETSSCGCSSLLPTLVLITRDVKLWLLIIVARIGVDH